MNKTYRLITALVVLINIALLIIGKGFNVWIDAIRSSNWINVIILLVLFLWVMTYVAIHLMFVFNSEEEIDPLFGVLIVIFYMAILFAFRPVRNVLNHNIYLKFFWIIILAYDVYHVGLSIHQTVTE